MDTREVADLLLAEKQKLLKATDYIAAFYKQIFSSLVNLRETLFDHVFPGHQDWKKQLREDNETVNFQEFGLVSADGRMQNNADFLVSVLNNIQAVQNNFLSNLDSLTVLGVEQFKAVNDYIRSFIQRLYLKENLTIISGQRLEVALSIRHNIEDRLENNIGPFVHYLELIVKDQYRFVLFSELKRLVGNYRNYMQDPFGYDKQIKQKCLDLNLEYHQELILGIIADLSGDETVYFEGILTKYKNEESVDQKKNTYRLKEIASRFLAQSSNIGRLENFLYSVRSAFQPVSFIDRLLYFFRRLLTGKEIHERQKDFIFTYSSRQGKLELKHASLQGLLEELEQFKSFLAKFRGTLELHSYPKSATRAATATEKLDNVIDNCITELTRIYEQCSGLREWLVNPRYAKMLRKLPAARQEDFNSVLLAINYTLIINKQYIRDMRAPVK